MYADVRIYTRVCVCTYIYEPFFEMLCVRMSYCIRMSHGYIDNTCRYVYLYIHLYRHLYAFV